MDTFNERGTAIPENTRTISSNVSGQVQTIHYRVGRSVSAGDVLFEIDDSESYRVLSEQLSSLALQQRGLQISSDMQSSELSVSREQLKAQLSLTQKQYDALFGENGSAAAMIESAQSNYELAVRARDYTKQLFEQGLASESDYRSAEGSLQAAQAALASTLAECSEKSRVFYADQINTVQAQLNAIERGNSSLGASSNNQSAQIQLQMDSLRDRIDAKPATAPVDGIVGKLLVTEGQYVFENQPLAIVYAEGGLLIEVSLLEENAIALSTGQRVDCALVDDTPFSAIITFISPIVEESISTIGLAESRRRIELVPDSMPISLCAGSAVDLTFSSVAEEQALSVPASALVPIGAGSGVYVLRNGRLSLITVQTGVRASGRVAIVSGIEDGDIVLRAPYQNGVKNGARAVAS